MEPPALSGTSLLTELAEPLTLPPSAFPHLCEGTHSLVGWGRGYRAEAGPRTAGWRAGGPSSKYAGTGAGWGEQAQQLWAVTESAGSGGKKGKTPGAGAQGGLPPHPRPRFHFYL